MQDELRHDKTGGRALNALKQNKARQEKCRNKTQGDQLLKEDKTRQGTRM